MSYIKVPLNNIINIEKIVSVFSMSLAPDYYYEGEAHDFWEIIYVDEGEISIRYGDMRCAMSEGDIFFHRPEEFHNVECDGVHSARIFIASFECRSAAMDFFIERRIRLAEELRGAIREILDEAAHCFVSHSLPLKLNGDAPVGSQQLLRCYLEMLLIKVMRQAESAGDRSVFTSREELVDRLAGDITDYLEERVYGDVSLDELCESFHFCKSHLCHIYKARTGVSIKRRLMLLKLEEAKRLLSDGGLTVSEISDRLGFDSPQYFARIFKQAVGRSPSEYRRGQLL